MPDVCTPDTTSPARTRVTSAPTVSSRYPRGNLKLKEVKAVYQYIKFRLENNDKNGNEVTVSLKNTYNFTSLADFDLRWETVKDGYVVGADSMQLADVAPMIPFHSLCRCRELT